MSCCTKYLDLGCVGSCGMIELPFDATQTGTHIIQALFAGVENEYQFDATSGSPFQIDLSEFNENSLIRFRILQPDGEYFTQTSDDVVYECFAFKTRIGYRTNITPSNDDLLLQEEGDFIKLE